MAPDIPRDVAALVSSDRAPDRGTAPASTDDDPLLRALAEASRARDRAEADVRRLIAYGREFLHPRPYTLDALATAAGMSISGVRTAYDHHDIDAVAGFVGRTPQPRRNAEPGRSPTAAQDLQQLVATLQEDSPPEIHDTMMKMAILLRAQGWTASRPPARSPGARTTGRRLHWHRTWPYGTDMTIYQEPRLLVAARRLSRHGPDHFTIDYAAIGARKAGSLMQKFADVIERHDAIGHKGDA